MRGGKLETVTKLQMSVGTEPGIVDGATYMYIQPEINPHSGHRTSCRVTVEKEAGDPDVRAQLIQMVSCHVTVGSEITYLHVGKPGLVQSGT